MDAKIIIVSTVKLTDEQTASILAINANIDLHQFPKTNVEDIPQNIWEECSILLTWSKIPTPTLAPNLKWVQTISAGVNTIVNESLFQEKEVLLTNSSGANSPQVAEHALALLLAMSRKIPDLIDHQSKGSWIWNNNNKKYAPIDVMGSTVGILGYGSIGRQIARLLQPFNCDVLVTKNNAKQIIDDGYSLENTGDKEGEFFSRLYPTAATASMVEKCDFLIVTLPLTESTKGFVSESLFKVMKPTSILIDVSRGGIVNHNALIGALVNNQIAGAALDVFPVEPLSNESSLWQFSNVFISPHVAGVSKEVLNRTVIIFTKNLNRHFNGQQLLNIVDTKLGY